MKQTTSRKTTTRGNFWVKLLVVLMLVFMSAELINANNRILITGWDLFNISLEVSDYNEATITTDEMTERIQQVEGMRYEIYHSEDWLIRTFANSHVSVKLVVILMAIVCYPVVGLLWISLIVEAVEDRIGRNKRNA